MLTSMATSSRHCPLLSDVFASLSFIPWSIPLLGVNVFLDAFPTGSVLCSFHIMDVSALAPRVLTAGAQLSMWGLSQFACDWDHAPAG